MIFPGSFIWRHISDKWLMSKIASVLFAISSIVIAGMTAVLGSDVQIQNTGAFSAFFWAVAGSLCGVSIFFLWGGMWRYWMLGKPSNRIARRIWFALLVVGVWYGALLYYALVYMPAIRKRERGHLEGMAK
jgi:drug/metabolite transporter (DMT)-like permease